MVKSASAHHSAPSNIRSTVIRIDELVSRGNDASATSILRKDDRPTASLALTCPVSPRDLAGARSKTILQIASRRGGIGSFHWIFCDLHGMGMPGRWQRIAPIKTMASVLDGTRIRLTVQRCPKAFEGSRRRELMRSAVSRHETNAALTDPQTKEQFAKLDRTAIGARPMTAASWSIRVANSRLIRGIYGISPRWDGAVPRSKADELRHPYRHSLNAAYRSRD